MDALTAYGVPVVAVTPAVVQVAKQLGLPTRWAGVAAMLTAGALSLLVDAQTGGATLTQQDVSGYVLASVIYGLAAAGLYSQARVVQEVVGNAAPDAGG